MTEATRFTSKSGKSAASLDASSATPVLPPPAATWATRADLLRDRADALRVLHRADLALGIAAKTTLLVIGAACLFLFAGALAFGSAEDGAGGKGTSGSGLMLGALFALGALPLVWTALRRTLRAREVGRWRRAWEDLADAPEARALPRGNLDPALREPFDARADPDGDQFVGTALVGMYVAPWEGRLLVRAVPAGMGVAFGAISLIGIGVAWDPTLAGLLVVGPLMLVASGIQTVKSTQRGWRAAQRWKQAKQEHDQWRTQRSPGT